MAKEPTQGVGFLADPSFHKVQTTHIQALILEAHSLAVSSHDVVADGTPMVIGEHTTLVHMTLDRAANLLRHAAEELQDERFRALGWPEV